MVPLTLVVSFALAFLLSIINFSSELFRFKGLPGRHDILAFAGGFSIAYLFTALLPESIRAEGLLGNALYVSILAGFVLFRLAEVFVYKHAQAKQRKAELKLEHSLAFFVYHVLLGVSIGFFTSQSIREGVLFFIPVALHAVASSAALHELHGSITSNLVTRFVLAAAPVLGAFLSFVLPIAVFDVLIGLVVGALFFVVVKEFLPDARNARPGLFLVGTVTFLLVKLALGWFI
ncbi:hypothetical protein HY493_00990 [Candidatus Woesearchaeota archaeon]|nr:hypothetical protein [Candidatus Woesearchaeota archaeon]